MNRKQKIIVSITGIFIVLLALVGLTYAYFLTRITGNTNDKSIEVTTANLELLYGDGNGILEPARALMPGDDVWFIDENEEETKTKTFTVTNRGDDTEYFVVFENVKVTYAENSTVKVNGKDVAVKKGDFTTFESNDFRYTLTCTNNGVACNGMTNEVFPMTDGVVVGNNIAEGEVHNYTLTMTYLETNEDQSNDMNKTISALINIEAAETINPYSSKPTTLAYNIINNALSGSGSTKYRKTPLYKLGIEASPKKYEKADDEISIHNVVIPSSQNYIVYADDYTVDPVTGKFYLDQATKKYVQYGTGQSILNGKYVGNYDGTATVPNLSENTAYDSMALVINGAMKYEGYNYIEFYSIRKLLVSEEKTLSKTEDDYGISFYYKGDIRDNFVNFNGMCWRIVRVEGDGSIKLLLADSENTCDSKDFNISNKSSNFGPTNLGYKTENGATMQDYKNSTSGAKSIITSWFDSNFSSVKDKVKSDTTWCLGNLTDLYAHKSPFGKFSQTKADLINAGTRYYYEKRLSLSPEKGINNMFNPTLLCKNNNNEYDSSYVGLLTADELVFAGAVEDNVVSTYIRDNSESLTFTSTVVGYYTSGKYEAAYIASISDNSLGTGAINRDQTYVRPVISLKSGVEIVEGGIGTQDNPYVIK